VTPAIWVADAGAGIPVEEREHVFARFACRSRASGKPRLGLSIVPGLAESAGRLDRGPRTARAAAAFRVALPCAVARAAAV
jgi:K+-sensing histidine kinase KdpD